MSTVPNHDQEDTRPLEEFRPPSFGLADDYPAYVACCADLGHLASDPEFDSWLDRVNAEPADPGSFGPSEEDERWYASELAGAKGGAL